MKLAKFIMIIGILVAGIRLQAQNQYTLGSDHKITINGSSNVHDWEETAQTATGDASVVWNTDGSFVIKSFNLKVSVKSIKSDKGSVMDNKTHDALKADEHPYITFKMLSVKSMTKSGNGWAVKVNGDLTIAGFTKNIDISGMVYVKENGKLYIDVSRALKMTDFKIDPPTALMGTMQVADDITIRFKLNYNMK
ncbi:MAG TPA: YceI family protein [Chitinophagales bacterium]|nr:YceI family protein [Chitinophagales bacterium]HMX05521.1 YceI family protein [Chitinophagales bacterium]HNA58968.1 YceI family protein [Chitinophagales bacterium]HNF69385.1 YceI family protein [Chitinophagales bacterium]HNJ89590.1 YceI family protein [Chitinophagales bacterium]